MITLAEPVFAEVLLDTMYSTGQALILDQIYHVYSGEKMDFVGGYFPPTGLSKSELMKDYREFYEGMLTDLEKQSAGDASLLAELQARRSSFEKKGIMVYGLTVRGKDLDISELAKRVKAKDARITALDKADVPTQPSVDRMETSQPALQVQPAATAVVDYCPSSGVVQTYRDSQGWSVFYNTMTWTALNKAQFAPGEGYEHDVVLNNYDGSCWADGLQGTIRGTGWDSNLPYAYLDYAKIFDDPEEPVFTVGTFDGCSIVPGTTYYGWLKAYPGNTTVDTAKLVGQKTDVYAFSVWSVVVNRSVFIVGSWGIPVPSTYSWSH